ncbi:CstA-like transporter-associated (seleno)protein [Streptomyces lunaelactis]|uniref:CstA-like transporter-associated (seleno)protein n=1 Tax=Streptomyces lunaelactis TaxID=1535768 RepID=UPI001584E936|nr:YbdD/YjiX family protein [Streptomyces lunaelactis]NUK74256.1 YbdD/YjiX family protein [Streptomyces lunaelactis]
MLGRGTLSSGLRRAAGAGRWYVRGLMDESAYGRYVTHARSRDPAVSVLSRREFERMRTDRQESDPSGGFRCC